MWQRSFLSLQLIILTLGLSCLTSISLASTSENPSYNDRWHSLLHMQGSSPSKVKNTEFFLAKNGRFDAEAEKLASLAAFENPQIQYDPNQHPQCWFPARKKYFESIGYHFPEVECPDYEAWLDGLNAQSMSLVYASAYSENAASMFGHTFIRINPFPLPQGRPEPPSKHSHRNKLLGYTVGFLANVDPNDSSFNYAYKGITGQYTGSFQIDPYYVSTAIYTSSESRDLWEYDLKLSTDDIEFLVAHLWELYHRAVFEYYFFDENCSYYMMAFLQVIREKQDFVHNLNPVVLPIATVQDLNSINIFSGSLVRRLSLEEKLRRRYDGLNVDQRKRFFEIKNSNKSVDGLDHANTVDALLLFYDFRKQDQDGILSEEERNTVHNLRAALAKQNRDFFPIENTETPTALTPDRARSTPQISLGISTLHVNQTNYLDLGFRAGMHGLNNLDEGFEPWSEVRFFDANLKIPDRKKENIFLESFDLISVSSLTPITPWRKPWSWQLSLGSRQQMDSKKIDPKHHSITAAASAGLSWQSINRQFIISILPALFLEQDVFEKHDMRTWISGSGLMGWQGESLKTISTFETGRTIDSSGFCKKQRFEQNLSGANRILKAMDFKPELYFNFSLEMVRASKAGADCHRHGFQRELSTGIRAFI